MTLADDKDAECCQAYPFKRTQIKKLMVTTEESVFSKYYYPVFFKVHAGINTTANKVVEPKERY